MRFGSEAFRKAVVRWLIVAAVCTSAVSVEAASGPKGGINLSGGEFNPAGSQRGVDYEYPSVAEISDTARAGFRFIRLPFLAKRLLGTALRPQGDSQTDLQRVSTLVDAAARQGLVVVLDMHDYGFSREGELIGSTRESTASFAASWSAIASAFSNRSNVIFGLMNEPHFQSAVMWRQAANAAIAAIRATGARQGILVPSTDWSVAKRWSQNGTPEQMLQVVDPADNFVFEVHQYFDRDSAGKREEVEAGIGAAALHAATDWARINGKRMFLGEFAWARGSTAGAKEADEMLAHVHSNGDVWVGWAYWGGGARWGSYMFALDTGAGEATSQMRVLDRYIGQKLATDFRR